MNATRFVLLASSWPILITSLFTIKLSIRLFEFESASIFECERSSLQHWRPWTFRTYFMGARSGVKQELSAFDFILLSSEQLGRKLEDLDITFSKGCRIIVFHAEEIDDGPSEAKFQN